MDATRDRAGRSVQAGSIASRDFCRLIVPRQMGATTSFSAWLPPRQRSSRSNATSRPTRYSTPSQKTPATRDAGREELPDRGV